MSYISNLEIAELIEASKGYGDQLDRVDNDPQLYTDPLKLSWGEAASILKGKGYEPSEGIHYTDENFVLGYIFDDRYPDREAFLSIIDEHIPDGLTGKTPGWGSVVGGMIEDMAYQAYASLPSWFQGSLAGSARTLDHASMAWQEVDWKAWGKHMYNGDIWKASKAHKDGVDRFRKNYDAGVYDKKVAGKTLLPLGRNLSIIEDIYAERSDRLMKVHREDPKNRAYSNWMTTVNEKDLIPWFTDNPMSAKERTAYFMGAIAAPILTTGVGIGTYIATRDAKLAMKVASSMSFVVEGMDEWQQSFDYYIKEGYSPEMASRKSHLNAILYGASAFYIERLPMSRFLPKKSKVAVKKGIWNNLVAKSGELSDDLFKKYPSLATPQQAIKKVLNTKSSKFIETQALRAAAEALEEGIQLTVQTSIQHGYKGGEAWEGYAEELFESMRAGGLAGGGLGLAGSAAYKLAGVDSEEGPKPVTKKPEKEGDIPVTRIDKDKVKVSILLRLNNKSLSDNETQVGASLTKKDKTPESIIESIEKKGKIILSDLSISEDQLLTALKKRFPKNPELVVKAKAALEGEGITTEEQKPAGEPVTALKKKTSFMTDEEIIEFKRKQAEVTETAEEPTALTTPGGAVRVVKDAEGNIISEETNVEEFVVEDYNKLNVPKLKEELKNRNLTVSGKKADLVERLQAADEIAADEETAALTQTEEIAQTTEELEASLEEAAVEITPKDVHQAAEAVGMEWDDDADFMALSKKVTGQERIDDMTSEERASLISEIEKAPAEEENENVNLAIAWISSLKGRKDVEGYEGDITGDVWDERHGSLKKVFQSDTLEFEGTVDDFWQLLIDRKVIKAPTDMKDPRYTEKIKLDIIGSQFDKLGLRDVNIGAIATPEDYAFKYIKFNTPEGIRVYNTELNKFEEAPAEVAPSRVELQAPIRFDSGLEAPKWKTLFDSIFSGKQQTIQIEKINEETVKILPGLKSALPLIKRYEELKVSVSDFVDEDTGLFKTGLSVREQSIVNEYVDTHNKVVAKVTDVFNPLLKKEKVALLGEAEEAPAEEVHLWSEEDQTVYTASKVWKDSMPAATPEQIAKYPVKPLPDEAPAEDTGEQLEINLQKAATGKIPLIQQEKEIANKIITSLQTKFPEVSTLVKNILFDKDGNLIAGMSLGAVAAWSRKGASLDTPPHEYAHTLIEALIDNPIIQKAVKEYQIFDMTLDDGKGRDRTFDEAKESLVQDMGIYYAAKTITGKPKGVTARLKTFLRKFWMLVKKTFGKPAEYLMEEFYTADGSFKDVFADRKETAKASPYYGKIDKTFYEEQKHDTAAIEAIQAKYQTKLIGTTLKSITIMNNKFKTKKWQGKVTINHSFIRALTKRVGKEERKLITLVINEEGFLDKSITTEEFKIALMKYIYPVTIERAIKTFGVSQAMDEELYYETHPDERDAGIPTAQYTRLTAPGGVNYGEYNINVPFDVQRAHPGFVKNNTFAWFRADELETDPTTLRVNEIQSDLLQKKEFRDRETIISKPKGKKILSIGEITEIGKTNEFMKGMQVSDWEAYLTNSILQWAADQGYNKVMFPTGNTIDVIEGYNTINVDGAAASSLSALRANLAYANKNIMLAESTLQKLLTVKEIEILRTRELSLTDPFREFDIVEEGEASVQRIRNKINEADYGEAYKTWKTYLSSVTAIKNQIEHAEGIQKSINRIRRRYAELSKFLTHSRPGNIENITDKEGNTWIETILTDKDSSTKVPLYQQLTPDSAGGMRALRMMDDALNAMQSSLGKRFKIEEFIDKLSDTIPSAFASILDHWVNTHTNWKNVAKGMANISEAYATQEEFDRTVDDVTDALDEGLIKIQPNDFSVRAKNGINIQYAFLHALGIPINQVDLIKLMVEARQYTAQKGFTSTEAFENWADISLWNNTDFKYSNIPDTPKGKIQKRRIKQLYVRANSMILVNTKSKKPRYRSLVYNFSGDGLTWKTDTNPHTKETNSTSEQNMLYQTVKADMAWDNRPVFLRMSDIMERKGSEIKSWWQKLGQIMTSDDIKVLAKNALHFEFNPEKDGIDAKIYGLAMLSTRGDSGHLIFAPILAKHKALTARLSRMELYWKEEVNAGRISKDQAYQFMGYRKNADGKWITGKMGADTHWLAGEIARYEMMRNIMPDDIQVTGKDIGTKSSMSWMILGSEFFRRIKIMSTPVFTSPLMEATKAVQIASNEKERGKIVFVDRNGNEGDMMRNIAGMGSKNISDGATIVSWKFADLMNVAFGTDATKKLFKTVIWKADKSLAVKNEMFVGEMGMKIYREKEAGERELIAEMDHTGKLFSYMGDTKVEVDMLLTDDEAKHSSYNTGEVIDISGEEMGLIKYHEAKYNKAKFPQQWLNYVHDSKVIDMLQKHVLPRVERGLQRLFTLTSSSTMTPKILAKFMENLQSDSPHAITTALIEKAKLGLGLHPDAMPMLNKLLKTQIIDPTLQLAGGNGMYVDLAPDYFDTHSDNEITISQAEAKEVYKLYAKKEGGTWQDARDMGLKAINKWLEGDPVRVLVSRSPIPYIGGVKVLNIKAIHDRGGQTIISANNLIKIFEGDNDGDAVQIEFLPDELLDSIADTISKAAADNRINAINLRSYVKDNAAINDMSLVENVYKLTQKFQAGARAIGEIANTQNVLGQLNHIFNHIDTVHGRIKVHSLTDKVLFPEIGETKTLEEQLRIWIQAAVDNGKYLLLDDWGYSRDKLISRLFYIADEDGNKIGELSEEAIEIVKVLVREHTKAMHIRNGRNPAGPFSVRTGLNASQSYQAYTYDRAGILLERLEEAGIALETIGEISFNDKLAPIEEIVIKYSEMWGEYAEKGKVNPVEFEENTYKAVHNNVMRLMKETLTSGLESVIAAQGAVEGELTKTEIAEQVKRGRVWANKMWNEGKVNDVEWKRNPIGSAITAWADGKRGFVLLLEKWRGEIGPSSWDHNPDMIMFTEYWNDQFMDMTSIEQFVATHAFLQGFRQVGDKGKTHGQSNRRVLPPISDKENLTVLDPSVMREYLELYDLQLRNESSRTQEAVAVRNDAWSNIVEKIC